MVQPTDARNIINLFSKNARITSMLKLVLKSYNLAKKSYTKKLDFTKNFTCNSYPDLNTARLNCILSNLNKIVFCQI